MSYLVIADANKIQGFLFESVRLREIMGASLLLRKFNQIVRTKLQEYALTNSGVDCIYSEGGSVKFQTASTEQAIELSHFIQEKYQELTRTGSIAISQPQEFNSNNPKQFKQAMEKAELDLQQSKVQGVPPVPLVSLPYLTLCATCGLRPTARQHPVDNQFICETCEAKREARSKETALFFKELNDYLTKLHNQPFNLKSPEDFKAIGSRARPSGYTGCIVADGNRMGEKLAQCSDKDQYKNLSQQIVKCVDEALLNAIVTAFRLNDKTIATSYNQDYLPIQVLVKGGDDIVVVTTAETVLPLANHFCQEFSRVSNRTFSISAGVTLAKENLPFLISYGLAKQLLKSAKGLSRKLGSVHKVEYGTLDFHVVTASNALELKQIRQELTTTCKDPAAPRSRKADQLIFTARPYVVGAATPELKALFVQDVLSLLQDLKQAELPRSQLSNFNQMLNLSSLPPLLSSRDEFEELCKRLDAEYGRQVSRFKDSKVKTTWQRGQGLLAQLGTLSKNKLYAQQGIAGQLERIILLPDLIELYEFVALDVHSPEAFASSSQAI